MRYSEITATIHSQVVVTDLSASFYRLIQTEATARTKISVPPGMVAGHLPLARDLLSINRLGQLREEVLSL